MGGDPVSRIEAHLFDLFDRLEALFAEYVRYPQLLPEKHLRRWTGASSVIGPPPPGWVIAARTSLDCLERVVADYLAGMTDRFAIREHQRITGRRLFELA